MSTEKPTQHTPGPWQISASRANRDGDFLIQTNVEGWRMIATVHNRSEMAATVETAQEAEANAHLIEAAPELLSAMNRILECCRREGSLNSCVAQIARTAIAKARGTLPPAAPVKPTPPVNEVLLEAVGRLLDCPALNCESLEQHDTDAIEFAQAAQAKGLAAHPAMPEIDEAEEIARGENLAKVLGLRECPEYFEDENGKPQVRFNTSVGTKTALGLYRTLNRIFRGEKL